LATGKMPVRDLAPALLALGDVFAHASRQLYPDRDPVALSIKATEEGSFLVHLILEASQRWEVIRDMFGSETADALSNLRDLVVAPGVGLFFLFRSLRGRKVLSQNNSPVAGHMIVTLDDQTIIEVPAEVLAMYQNIEIRRNARRVVAPLNREGVERVVFEDPGKPPVVIEKPDLPTFELPEDEEILSEQEITMVLEIAAPSFQEGNKWRFSDGESTFWAAIEDQVFLSRVQSGIESFRKGDALQCRVKIIQTRDAEGLHTERRIVDVLDHIPRPEQMSLEG
jgi:hypothetical protein